MRRRKIDRYECKGRKITKKDRRKDERKKDRERKGMTKERPIEEDDE